MDQKVNWQLHTDGKGLWTQFEKMVTVTRIRVDNQNEEGDFGELRAYFDTRTWNADEVGLIYTDPRWLSELRSLMRTLGFSTRACLDITYSEQGMQGDDYVSMDVGAYFMREAEPLYRWLINKQPLVVA